MPARELASKWWQVELSHAPIARVIDPGAFEVIPFPAPERRGNGKDSNFEVDLLWGVVTNSLALRRIDGSRSVFVAQCVR